MKSVNPQTPKGVDATPPKVFWLHCPDRLHDLHQIFSTSSYTFSAFNCFTEWKSVRNHLVHNYAKSGLGGEAATLLCEHPSKQIFKLFLVHKFFWGVTYVSERHFLHIKSFKMQNKKSFFFSKKINKIIILYSIFRKKSKTHAIHTYQIVGND